MSITDLKGVYNQITNSLKSQFDEIKLDQVYTSSLVMNGLGNKGAFSLTTIGLDGRIDPNTKKIVDKGVSPEDRIDPETGEKINLLSKQFNFSKVVNSLSDISGNWFSGEKAVPIVTDYYQNNFTQKDLNEAKNNNESVLENFYGKGKDHTRDQMTYAKYSPVKNHSVYKIYNPINKEAIWVTLPNSEIEKLEEDNYTYSRTNALQRIFNLDGEIPLSNFSLNNQKDAFTSTPRLINNNNQYAVEFKFYNKDGQEKTYTKDVGYIGEFNVQKAQVIANNLLERQVSRLNRMLQNQ